MKREKQNKLMWCNWLEWRSYWLFYQCYGGCAICIIDKNINDGFIDIKDSLCFT
jgi:hypothetical protein